MIDSPAISLHEHQTAAATGDAMEVSPELLELLAAEAASMRVELDQAVVAATSPDSPPFARREALESYRSQLRRLAEASDMIGLATLARVLGQMDENLAVLCDREVTSPQQQALQRLPILLAAHLSTPGDEDACRELTDLLRSEAWAAPLPADRAALWAKEMSLIPLGEPAADAPPRPIEAHPADVSLEVPADTSEELLDALLQDLPAQNEEFTTAVQRITGGEGSLDDVETAQRAAHTLKGAANTVGVRGIANLSHHLEDILVALTRHRILPGPALRETLMNAADCLSAMIETIMGQGAFPDNALRVYQEVLDWANRVDREGPECIAGSAESEEKPVAVEASEAATDAGAGPASATTATPTIRVSAALIDELLRLIGEGLIANSQMRERLAAVSARARALREQNDDFLRIAAELENFVDFKAAATPLASPGPQGDFDALEFDHYGDLHTVSRRLVEAAHDAKEMGEGVAHELAALVELAGAQHRLHRDSQQAVLATRMVPVSTVTARLHRAVRQACRLLGREATLTINGADTLVDGNLLGQLVDPLMHVLRNAVDHGIETPEARAQAGKSAAGHIELTFAREANLFVVRCRDDGAGLDTAAIRRTAEARQLIDVGQTLPDAEMARLILTPGFSTRSEATQVSGRGIGMDAVNRRVQDLNGAVGLHSEPGKGVTVELRLPAALASTHALLVRLAAQTVAISGNGVQDIHYAAEEEVKIVGTGLAWRLGDRIVPVVDLETLLDLGDTDAPPGTGRALLLVRRDDGALQAVRCRQLVGSRDLVVKSLSRYLPRIAGIVGVTVLGDGSAAPVIDLPDLIRHAHAPRTVQPASTLQAPPAWRPTVLVVDDSLSARRATAQVLADAGFEVRTAVDGLDAAGMLDRALPDLLVADLEMPRMNGLELAAHLRARPGGGDIPIVMITSRSTDKHRAQAMAAGVNEYFAKPFNEDQLLASVNRLVTRHG